MYLTFKLPNQFNPCSSQLIMTCSLQTLVNNSQHFKSLPLSPWKLLVFYWTEDEFRLDFAEWLSTGGLSVWHFVSCSLKTSRFPGLLLIRPLTTNLKFESKYNHFHRRKCIWKWLLQKYVHFVLVSSCYLPSGPTPKFPNSPVWDQCVLHSKPSGIPFSPRSNRSHSITCLQNPGLTEGSLQ